MAIALIRTFIARGIAALGSLALVVVIGRLYGASGVGVYALAFSIILGTAILARYGMNNAIMRFVGQDHHSPHVMVYLSWGVKKALLLSFIAALVIFFARFYLESIFDAEGLSVVLTGIAIATPAFTLGYVLSGFFKGIRMPATACLLEHGSVSLVAAVLIFLIHSSGVAAIGWGFALASWLVLLQGICQIWLWWRQQNWEHSTTAYEPLVTRKQFAISSRAFFVMSLAGFMQRVLSIAIAGWLLSSDELGLFKTSQETGMAIAFILIVINAIFPPRFARLYHQQNMQALGRLARQGALLGALVAAPPLLVCFLFPGWVLGLFGSEFVAATPLLRLIAVAQLINVATGSVGFLLNMTGHEPLMRNIALSCNAIGLLLFFVLIPPFGPMGAAMALAFVLVVQNLVALFYVWRRLRIWTLPMPNVLKWLGV
ncbi:oligosaccharide flippase family protein [Aidingimonas halophila]|nr:oligosaccharide flippase family protein [Aidingimonas halophila]GHC35094.1 capsular polysaccharide biosynthesis protein [Aidingimonas halophila]